MEINLLDQYPSSPRPIEQRGGLKFAESRESLGEGNEVMQPSVYIDSLLTQKLREFGKEYFDGNRVHGYGGYYYNPKFWSETVQRIHRFYNLTGTESILDVGCAKGFLLHDFKQYMSHCTVTGVDISQYAIDCAIDDMKPHIHQASADSLPFADRSFDLVLSINTIDHLPKARCIEAVRQIQRVQRKHAYIVVNAWSSEQERLRQQKWNLTSLTCLHVDQWRELFAAAGYTGDYYWFIPS